MWSAIQRTQPGRLSRILSPHYAWTRIMRWPTRGWRWRVQSCGSASLPRRNTRRGKNGPTRKLNEQSNWTMSWRKHTKPWQRFIVMQSLTGIESGRALELNSNLDMPHFYRAAAFYHLGLMDEVETE